MPRPRTIPDPDELQRLLRTHTQSEIAAMHNVTRQAISEAIGRYGLRKHFPARSRYSETLPWKVTPEHSRTSIAKRLRWVAKKQRGEALTEKDARSAELFLDMLKARNVVVDYDRDVPGGFILRPRKRTDKGIVRAPEGD